MPTNLLKLDFIQSPNLVMSKPLELIIDVWTPCLIHNKSGEKFPTSVEDLKLNELKKIGPKNGWNDFDWGIYYKNPTFNDTLIKKLCIKGDDTIQGVIAYEPKEGYIEVHLAESAPWNVSGKEFVGVGAHLFAMACKHSFELGFEGFVTFISKSNLIKHYEKNLGARVLNKQIRQMVIETEVAQKLVSTYF